MFIIIAQQELIFLKMSFFVKSFVADHAIAYRPPLRGSFSTQKKPSQIIFKVQSPTSPPPGEGPFGLGQSGSNQWPAKFFCHLRSHFRSLLADPLGGGAKTSQSLQKEKISHPTLVGGGEVGHILCNGTWPALPWGSRAQSVTPKTNQL